MAPQEAWEFLLNKGPLPSERPLSSQRTLPHRGPSKCSSFLAPHLSFTPLSPSESPLNAPHAVINPTFSQPLRTPPRPPK